MSDVLLNINDVDKVYSSATGDVHAVKGLSMQIQQGEIVSLLGSSGCGKTSTLRMIAGFEGISKGEISVAGQLINHLPPVKRNVAMAFEGYSLYPPLTVRDNIAFALKASRLSEAEVKDRVLQISTMLEIDDILDKYPSSISGGQQQRASLGRALVRDASLHLLDEPMGQLEPQLRALLRGRIKSYIKEKRLTAILVTHDQAEANALSDRIAVMEGGFLQQFDTPKNLKDRPANLFTGTFIGEPPMNVFRVSSDVADQLVRFNLSDEMSIQYPVSNFTSPVLEEILRRDTIDLGVRPYSIRRSEDGLNASVKVNQWLGDQSHIAATMAGHAVVMVEHDRARDEPGQSIKLTINAKDLHLFDSVTGNAIAHGGELA